MRPNPSSQSAIHLPAVEFMAAKPSKAPRQWRVFDWKGRGAGSTLNDQTSATASARRRSQAVIPTLFLAALGLATTSGKQIQNVYPGLQRSSSVMKTLFGSAT